ncbi:MAG: hypothetical protein MRECE_45c012 [Mycoplasmataceae bacterium CE_OT135]|nr:MAG: hypothetical protein MRECE_45c012 [Mycoplasmataceae bacterium CE_OT135]
MRSVWTISPVPLALNLMPCLVLTTQSKLSLAFSFDLM